MTRIGNPPGPGGRPALDALPTLARVAPTQTGGTAPSRDRLVAGGAPTSALAQAHAPARTVKLPGAAPALVTAMQTPGDPVAQLFGLRPTAEVVADLQTRSYPRAALASVLQAQQKARGATAPQVYANIAKLAEPGTAAVVTGQQVGVLGGPLYSLFKALGAVNHAAELEKRGMPAVPVFWLASYDADLKEVQQASVVSGAPEAKVGSLGLKDQARPVGGLAIGPGAGKLVDDLAAALPDGPRKAELVAELRAIYTPEATFTEAFAKLVGRLTDQFGLVMLDPSDRAFAALTRPVIEKELFAPTSSQAAIDAASAQLGALGHKVQVESKTDRLNVFFVDDGGRRVFMKRAADGGFETGGTPGKLSAAEARALLASAPERFSPSALLRPIVEDSVLPTAAYVGGPAEVSYFAQIGGVYDWAGVAKPTVVSRPSFGFVTQAEDKRVFDRTGKSVEQLLADPKLTETVGWAGLPAPVAKAYAALQAEAVDAQAFLGKLEGVLEQRAWPVAEKLVKERRASVARRLDDVKREVKAAGLERCQKGLDHQAPQVDQGFQAMLDQLAEAQKTPSHTPARGALGKAIGGLGGLVDQALKVGRQEAGDVMQVVNRLQPGGDPQERQMTIGQLFVERGPEVAATFADLARVGEPGRTLVVLK
jgi:bacillithiol biosynthesis cysteine-adding enzyme BshC